MQNINAYLGDLRKKIVEALRRGATKSETARTFGVSRSSVKRYARLAEQVRSLAPKKRLGSKPQLDERVTKLLGVRRGEAPYDHPLRAARVRAEGCRGSRMSDSTISRIC